ncbi:hypothetical protein SAMN05216383_10257 [Prevotella sp. KH2C16]|nr:hypothetical protein SAMN05216383_10257 [Prevotella sp. KH2C16]
MYLFFFLLFFVVLHIINYFCAFKFLYDFWCSPYEKTDVNLVRYSGC